jgi:hypothetical protein
VALRCLYCKEEHMTYKPSDFARCNGNPALGYCPQCKRNVKNSPVHPEAMRQCWIGPWVVEELPCPNFKEMKND